MPCPGWAVGTSTKLIGDFRNEFPVYGIAVESKFCDFLADFSPSINNYTSCTNVLVLT